jgi:integrase
VGNVRRDRFDEAAATIGVPGLTVHELRHTAVTLAIEVGASVTDVQRMLGHKTATLVLSRYGHLLEDDRRVAEALSRAAVAARERRAQQDPR